MKQTELDDFKQKLTTYASKNLIRIKAFIESPSVSSYLTQEVTTSSSVPISPTPIPTPAPTPTPTPTPTPAPTPAPTCVAG